MAKYIILTRISPDAFEDPENFKQLAANVSARIKSECPDLKWKHSYATLGHFDFVDIIECDDPKQIKKAAMIIHTYGHSSTETMLATPWKEFLANI